MWLRHGPPSALRVEIWKTTARGRHNRDRPDEGRRGERDLGRHHDPAGAAAIATGRLQKGGFASAS
jgi:hypothetical protein